TDIEAELLQAVEPVVGGIGPQAALPVADMSGIISFAEVRDFDLSPTVLTMVPTKLIRSFRLLPMKLAGNLLTIAMVNPRDNAALAERHPPRADDARVPSAVPRQRPATGLDRTDPGEHLPQGRHRAHQGAGRPRHHRTAAAAGRPDRRDCGKARDRSARVYLAGEPGREDRPAHPGSGGKHAGAGADLPRAWGARGRPEGIEPALR